jgi:1-acyl-sn-glycerol-3-phosphate acyltransferase
MHRKMLRNVLFTVFIKPLIWIVLGLTVKHRDRLPLDGPAILVANHNSHLDTLLLMALYPTCKLVKVRPVAAKDYFCKKKYLEYVSRNILQIIPISRHRDCENRNPLDGVSQAIEQGAIIIYYPEGTRGLPEQLGQFKKGIAFLAKKHPQVSIVPIFLKGLGRVLPKGKRLFIPFNVKAIVGTPFKSNASHSDFVAALREKMTLLEKQIAYDAT